MPRNEKHGVSRRDFARLVGLTGWIPFALHADTAWAQAPAIGPAPASADEKSLAHGARAVPDAARPRRDERGQSLSVECAGAARRSTTSRRTWTPTLRARTAASSPKARKRRARRWPNSFGSRPKRSSSPATRARRTTRCRTVST